MSADFLAPLARLVTTADAIEGRRDLFAAEEPLDHIAARVAETAVAAIPNADAISITVLTWPDARTAASTHECALELDHHQYASGRGPCLEAAWQRTPVRAVIGEEHQRWPEFVEAAQREGIRASLSVPLLIAGLDKEQELVGSLNIYSHIESRIRSVRRCTDAPVHRCSRASDQQRRPLAELQRNVTQLEKGTPLAFRHRHGQRRSNSAARLRPGRGVRQTGGRIPKAQHQLRDVAVEMLDRMQASGHSVGLARIAPAGVFRSYGLIRGRRGHPSAIIANRHVHSRFRGATPVSCTLSGTQRNGADTATSVWRPASAGNVAELHRDSCLGRWSDLRQQHKFLAGDAALDHGLIVDHRWPSSDGVQDARTGRRPVGTDSTDSAVPDDPS